MRDTSEYKNQFDRDLRIAVATRIGRSAADRLKIYMCYNIANDDLSFAFTFDDKKFITRNRRLCQTDDNLQFIIDVSRDLSEMC